MGRPQHESHQPPRPQSVGEMRVSQGLAHLIMPPAGKHFPLATFEPARRSGELAGWRGKQTLPAVKKERPGFRPAFPTHNENKALTFLFSSRAGYQHPFSNAAPQTCACQSHTMLGYCVIASLTRTDNTLCRVPRQSPVLGTRSQGLIQVGM